MILRVHSGSEKFPAGFSWAAVWFNETDLCVVWGKTKREAAEKGKKEFGHLRDGVSLIGRISPPGARASVTEAVSWKVCH